MDHIVNAELGYVDINRFRNLERQAFHRHRANQRLENATIGDALGAAREFERHLDLDGALQVDFVEVGMKNFARHGRALHFLEDDMAAIELGRARLEPHDSGMGRRRKARAQFGAEDRDWGWLRAGAIEDRGDAAFTPECTNNAPGLYRPFFTIQF